MVPLQKAEIMRSTPLSRFVYSLLGKTATQDVWPVNMDNQYELARPMIAAEIKSQTRFGWGQNGAFPPVATTNVVSPQVVFRGVSFPEAVDFEALRVSSLPNLDDPTS